MARGATVLSAMVAAAVASGAAAEPPSQVTVLAPELPKRLKRTDEEKQRARRSYEEAQRLYGEGRLEEASREAERAFGFLPNASTALLRGFMRGAENKHREAVEAYLLALALSPTPEERQVVDEGLATHCAALEPPVGWLLVVSEPPGARVRLAGVEVKTPSSIALPEGRYDLTVVAEGFVEVVSHVDVRPGVGEVLGHTLVPRPPDPPPVKDDPPDPIRPPEPPPLAVVHAPKAASPSPLTIGLWAGGGAAILTGFGLHLWALDAASDTERYSVAQPGLSEEERARRHRDAADVADSAAPAAYVCYALGVGLAAAGTWLFVSGETDTTITPAPTEGGASVSVRTTF